MLENRNILLGVTGGVAAYKAVELAGKLVAAGASVKTILTESACQLIGPKSFEAVTSSAVYTGLWNADCLYEIDHIALSDWANIVVVAPATANILGKIANGICDDLLSTTICACWPQIQSGAAILFPQRCQREEHGVGEDSYDFKRPGSAPYGGDARLRPGRQGCIPRTRVAQYPLCGSGQGSGLVEI